MAVLEPCHEVFYQNLYTLFFISTSKFYLILSGAYFSDFEPQMVLRWCLYFNNTNSAEIGQLETEHCTKIDVFLSVRFPGKNKMENSTFI